MATVHAWRFSAPPEFQEWIDALRDVAGRARILARIKRLGDGNPGDHRENIAKGVSELRVDVGPGYRVYYSKRGDALIILLCGGDKGSQAADIRKAEELAENL